MRWSQFKKLRSLNLHWFVPFAMTQEYYHGRRSLIYVVRWGRGCWELWDWDKGIDVDRMYELQKKGASMAEVYHRIKLSATMHLRTTDWQTAKDARR